MTNDEKILVCVRNMANGEQLIRRGGELSQMLHCPLYVLNITSGQTETPTQEQKKDTEFWQRKCEEWGATLIVESFDNKKINEVIAETASRYHITQLIIGQPGQTRWQEIMHGCFVNDLLSLLTEVDVHVVAVQRLNDEVHA
ncbi:hypothetical protein ACFP56_17385 [Paenibacillus septentrionalis]|uniref:Universal stress protein n=1 Tax=Paenibacillus septentrionalis TaxID=429342 RepID=A0ABW1VA74_9BACL